MADQITVGTVVELKSGGPDMTVSEVKSWNGVTTAWCDWFEGKDKKTGSFPVTSLKAVTEESGSVDYSPSDGGPQSWMR
jgi:uncharacterized protein YodC (DUF2158 family)